MGFNANIFSYPIIVTKSSFEIGTEKLLHAQIQ